MNTSSNPIRISVIVCTYNHAASLAQTLQSLAAMQVPQHLRWELIVIDNNSNDATANTVHGFLATAPLNGRYAFEARQGLSAARNCGLALASGEIVAFTDDDVKVSPTWLADLDREFRVDPAVGMVCGRTIPYRADVYPIGVKDVPKRERFNHPCQPFAVGLGNNMIVRRSVTQQIGGFDVALGAGTRNGAAEDTDYIYRVLRAGHAVLYSPQVLVYHDHDRTTETQIRRIQYNYCRGRGAFLIKHVCHGDRWALKLLYWEHLNLCKDVLRDRGSRRQALGRLAATLAGGLRRLGTELRELFVSADQDRPARSIGP